MDWSVGAPWGKIACVSWGDPRRPPVLLVHGYMDSAATFIPLVSLLPDDHYYVAVDMPGHGRSDPFPLGLVVTHMHQLEATRRVVDHLRWTSFIYVSHSIGFIIGVLYNAVYPGTIKRMVLLDPVPPLANYCYYQYDPIVWFTFTHKDFYEYKWEIQRNKTFSYEEAVKSIMLVRNVNREQAAVLLSRCLINVGDGIYRFSWEPTMKKIGVLPITEDTLYNLMKLSLPTLNICAEDSFEMENGVKLIKKFVESIKDFHIFSVIGSHDVHVTNPERISDVVIDFIRNGYIKKSLLYKL